MNLILEILKNFIRIVGVGKREAKSKKSSPQELNKAKEIANKNPSHIWSDGIWSVQDLVNEAQGAIEVLERKGNIRWLKKYGISDSDLVVPKHIGMFVVDESAIFHLPKWNAKERCYKLSTTWGVPNFAFVGIDRRKYVEDFNDESNTWGIVLIYRLVCLPDRFFPTGPGYAYEATVIMPWDSSPKKLPRESYYFTINPDDGRMYPCSFLRTEKVRLPNPKRKDSSGNRSGGSVPVPKLDVLRGWYGNEWDDLYAAGDNGSSDLLPDTSLAPIRAANKKYKEHGLDVSFGIYAAMALSSMSGVESHWRLRVAKKVPGFSDREIACNMTINEKLVQRLFKDRDKVEMVMSPTGRRRPILHWVKAHHRVRKQGFFKNKKVSNVKTHLRGIRHFVMNGLDCRLELPGQYTTTINDWDIVTMRDMWVKSGKQIGMDEQVFQKLKDHKDEDGSEKDLNYYLLDDAPKRLFKPKYYTVAKMT